MLIGLAVGLGLAAALGLVAWWQWRIRAECELARQAAVARADRAEQAVAATVVLQRRNADERDLLRGELAAQRLHDPVTGLPGRALFLDRLGHALELAARRAEVLGVFLLDPRPIGTVTLSPAERDGFALSVAGRVQSALRQGDSAARLDDGRNAILLEALHDVFDAAAVAERLLDRFLTSIPADDGGVFVSPQIGIALSGGHERPDELLDQAEAALATVRRSALAPYAIFDPSMTVAAIDRAELEIEVRRALANGDLCLRFQPIVRLDDGEVVAYEALPVWRRPTRGFVGPEEVLTLADAVGLTLPLGHWMLATACRWSADRQHADPADRRIVCLDVPSRLFHHPGLAGDVARVLHEAGLNPRRLRLEIAQGLALEDVGATMARLQALKGVGVEVAIDGFGTGYAALGFLGNCPVDSLKVSKTYVAGLGADPDDRAIVHGALAFGRGLGIPVIADGDETATQRDELRRLGCALGQGVLFGAPKPAEEILPIGDPRMPDASVQTSQG